MIHLILCAVRYFFICAIHRRAGCKNQMLYACISIVIGMPAAFQHVIKADQITLDVCVRIRNRIPHACLCRQIYYDIRFFAFKQLLHRSSVRNIHSDKLKIRITVQLF